LYRGSCALQQTGGGFAEASFAGQNDTYLNIAADEALLDAYRIVVWNLISLTALSLQVTITTFDYFQSGLMWG